MIGNDVIDLEAAKRESNWQRRGFLQKLFTVQEQELILTHKKPEIMVWLLWSMKESAYKIYNRQTGKRAFIPHLLECSVDINSLLGKVTHGDNFYLTNSIINGSLIKTVAVTQPGHFYSIVELQNVTVFKDDFKLPYVVYNSCVVPVSVSHHGQYSNIVGLSYQGKQINHQL